MIPGRIISVDSSEFTVLTPEGRLKASCRGSFRHTGLKPCAGDMVTVDLSGGSPVISEISERKSYVSKPPCANFDTMLITACESYPKTDLFFIDSLTRLCSVINVTPAICITKTDLCPSNELRSVYSGLYDTFCVSAESDSGLDELTDFLFGRVTLVTGNSGVGKSSLINRLLPGANLQTGELSRRISRGKQTTRKVEFFELGNGGLIADSAGYSSLEQVLDTLLKKSPECGVFTEFERYVPDCRWKDCSHTGDEGCAVALAAEAGRISQSRLLSYRKLYEFYKNHPQF